MVFDVGNRVNLKRDMYNDILTLKKYIKLFHIKDKNNNNANVMLGQGNVKFHKLFKIINSIYYKSSFTIESTRGDNPVNSAFANYKFLKKFI